VQDALGAIVRVLVATGEWIVSPAVMGTAAAIALATLLVYLLLPHARRRRLRQFVTGFRETTTVDFYRDFLWALSKRGIRKHPALTAREFARQIGGTVAGTDVEFVTERFYETRYRGTPPTMEDRERIDRIIAELLKKPGEPTPAWTSLRE
jgi:hypothetical protein